MIILENYILDGINTFGVPAKTKYFTELQNEEDIKNVFNSPIFKENKKLFLGGGSNTLFTRDYDGIVVQNKLKGISILKEDVDFVYVRAMSGEWWHSLVLFTVTRGYWGIENLSFIPGTVGAAPIQNIGAYGRELKDSLYQVEAIEIETGKIKIFSKEECKFGYRESVFKNELKGKYFVFAIVLKLSKKKDENANYKALSDYLIKNNIVIKSSKDVSDAVTAVRKSKLPDPAILGNAGSFFKNVFVQKEKLEELLKKYKDMPYYFEKMDEENIDEKKEIEQKNPNIKIPAGWLIEQCGWKGKKVGRVGVHDKQALVLVNYGGATGAEVKELADSIIDSVYLSFGIKLTPEVNLI